MSVFIYKSVPRISVLSTTFVRCQVSSRENGVPADPRTGDVSFAFTANDVSPVLGDWVAGSWDAQGQTYWAKALIGPGPGAHVLATGTYDVWVRLVKGVETVIELVGRLTIY